jgi:hypothetical protein
VGDIIQVNGVGSGGWTIAQNAGQSTIINGITGISGTSGVISGSQYGAIELQYVGGGAFTVLNYTGNVGVLLPNGYVYEGGLTWMPPYTNSGNGLAWTDANTYCTNTVINGVPGWRLPTEAEMNALYNAYPNNSAVLGGQGWTLGYTWSSTPYGGGYYYYVNLGYGVSTWYYETNSLPVTCVR